MRIGLLFSLLVFLAACDSNDLTFTGDPDTFTISSPVSNDTLVVGEPFVLKGSLDWDLESVQVEVDLSSTVFFVAQIQNSENTRPFTFEEEFIITTATGSNEPVEGLFRLIWDEGNAVLTVPVFVK